MDNRPVGVYDSGLGGLTVWREIRRQLPEDVYKRQGEGLYLFHFDVVL